VFYYQKVFGRQFWINPIFIRSVDLFQINIHRFHFNDQIGQIHFNITDHKFGEMILTISCVDDEYHQRNLTLAVINWARLRCGFRTVDGYNNYTKSIVSWLPARSRH